MSNRTRGFIANDKDRENLLNVQLRKKITRAIVDVVSGKRMQAPS